MPVAVRQAVSNPMSVLVLNGKESRNPGNCSSKSNPGEGMIRINASASSTVEVTRPSRFESGLYLSGTAIKGIVPACLVNAKPCPVW